MISEPFLKEIAGILLQSDAYDLPSTCIVFPNKRARLYLSKYIGELTGKPVWAPRYLTISELMEKISGYFFADRLSLMFELYNAYGKVTGSNESFDSFYPYSETLLADFDEIDKYLVNADDLFQNLAGLKSLDGRFNYLSEEQLIHIRRFWRSFQTEKSSGQTVFISLWESLQGIYHELNRSLSEKGLAYEGMAYRKAVENAEASLLEIESIQKYLFVGFNALNACEEKLFRHLNNSNRAEFFWDYDDWYTQNDIHEAGFFIRNNLKNFPQQKELKHDHLKTTKNNILFVPVSSNSGQASVLPHIFSKLGITDHDDVEHTALVLADEQLLMPALYAIPESIVDINVTMGFPLSGSAVFSLIDSLYELFRNARKGKDGTNTWYFRDVLALMNNPLLKTWYGDKADHVRQKSLEHHMVYLSLSDINPDVPDDIIFNGQLHDEPCRFLLEVFTGIIRLLPIGSERTKGVEPVQVELLFQIFTFLTRLQDILNAQHFSPGADVLFRLIRKMLKSMHIPFSGEPLAGLQVLGILETRTLDFDHVIILSANEGVLPASADKPSFIPYNLRAGFGMPTPEHHDAIYAYYFYRLIQRAVNVVLVYDASTGGMRTGERSRFLHQLYYEMRLPVREMLIESTISQVPVKSIVIEKSGDIVNALKNYTGEKGRTLSPSAINEFLNCPMRFYFHHIAGLPQPEEVAEDVDARIFGSILHSALKRLYEGFGNDIVTVEQINALLKDEKAINTSLDLAFSEILFGDETGTSDRRPEGYNLIVRQVIFAYIRQFLRTELEYCPFTVVSLEEKYSVKLPVNIGGIVTDVWVGGIIDRIDRYDGKIRILDYKTGAVKDKFNSVESLFNAGEKLRNDAAFQVLLYAYVYGTLHSDEKIVPGLFFIRQSHAGNFSPNIQMGKTPLSDFDAIRQEFETLLKVSLERMFNIGLPFEQTDNVKVCKYCPYAMICRRE